MHEEIREYIAANRGLMLQTLRELCLIPAPSHHEEARAEYCRAWLERNGCTGAYIDGAKNVIFPLGCDGSCDITVLAAHTDTVFPDTEPMPYHDDGERIHCPGCADDTAAVVILMLTAKFFAQKGIVPKKGILFVCNSCEEGLGNLKGVRALFEAYAGRIGCFVSYDSELNCAHDICVGSHRYEVTAKTVGGHSFNDFGAPNAIAALAGVVAEIYKIDVPRRGASHTTYNVGTISGGTSVNTIAQQAEMLYEYRSDHRECLAQMENMFFGVIENFRRGGVDIEVEKIGDRPCSGAADPQARKALADMACEMCMRIRSESSLNRVVLSGGVFQNMFLMNRLMDRLFESGFEVYRHSKVPANDEGIAFGQIAIAERSCGAYVPCGTAENC